MAAKSLAVPAIVATSHLYFSIAGVRFGWIKQRLQCAAIDRYIAVSTAVKRHYCRDLGVPESKVRIVRTGVRDVRFSPSAVDGVRRALSAGGASPIVLTLGRLHDQKGHAHLLRAAALVPDAVFVLAGDGPERRSLETLARSLDVHGRVRFLGYRDDVPDLLAACDLMVLPSLYEGLPISILEAMAAGKPVVATRIGGTDEVVVDEETGLLVPAGDADALAVAIRRVLSDAALASRLGTNGKLRWMQHFSSEAMVREITAIYDELIGTVR